MMIKKWPWFLFTFIVILIDQGTKYWASMSLVPYQPVPVLPMLNFTLAFNTGAAFSFLSSSGEWSRWFFSVFSLLMSIFLVLWILRAPIKAHLQLFSLCLILGGAFANLIDRVLLAHVIDFIDVYYNNYHWPIFNLADSAICLGAFLLLVDLFKNPNG